MILSRFSLCSCGAAAICISPFQSPPSPLCALNPQMGRRAFSCLCCSSSLFFPFIRKILLFARYRRTDRQIYLFYYLLYYLLYYCLYYPGVILSPPCCHFGSTPLPFCPPQSDRLSRRLCHFVPHGHFVPGQKSLFCPAPLCLYYTIFSRVCK